MSIFTEASHSIPQACIQCAQEGLTCCYYRNDTKADMLLPIAYIECKNIASFLGISSLHVCFDEEIISQDFQNCMKAMFPGEEEKVEANFPLGGRRLHIALRGEIKHCMFLTPKGCLLPRSVRPIICTLFPFWVYKNGNYSLFGNCNLAPKGMDTIECIRNGVSSVTELYALYTMLRTFLGF